MISLKSWVRQVPDALRIDKKLSMLAHRSATARAVERLIANPLPQAVAIGRALRMLADQQDGPEHDWSRRIEAERRRLLGSNLPLNDGSLGPGGLVDAAISVREACLASKPARQALMLCLLARTLRPSRILELGTNLGISSAYLGAALKLNGVGGRIVTLDASPYRQRIARDIHARLGIDSIAYVDGLFSQTLSPTLEGIGPVDLAFVDGHHQYQPTLDYCEAILGNSAPGAVIVFDDIRWSDGMRSAWSRLRSDDRFAVVVDLIRLGVCVRKPDQSGSRLSVGPIHCV